MRLHIVIARSWNGVLSPIVGVTVDWIDLLFIVPAVAYSSPYMWYAVAVQYFARRWSVSARGFLLVFGVQPSRFWCKVFPGAARYASLSDQVPDEVMSSADQTSVPVPMLQEAVPGTGTNDSSAAQPHNLTKDQLLVEMALAKDERGRYIWSGKTIYTLKKGNHAEFLEWMRQLRNDDRTEQPEEPTVYTPIAGRPTKASYYQDEPELEFQPPPR